MSEWARKCFEASERGATVVLLAHARTDTRWFQDWVYRRTSEIRFVRGRLKFGDGRQSAPFPSLVAVYRPSARGAGNSAGFPRTSSILEPNPSQSGRS